MFIYLYIAVLCKFLHECVVCSVASFVVCGVIKLIGPGLSCLHVATMVLYPSCVYSRRCLDTFILLSGDLSDWCFSVLLITLCLVFWSPYVPFRHSLYLYADSECCRRFLFCHLYFSVSFHCLRVHRYIGIPVFLTFHLSVPPPSPSNKPDILNLNNWVSVLNRRMVRLPSPNQFVES